MSEQQNAGRDPRGQEPAGAGVPPELLAQSGLSICRYNCARKTISLTGPAARLMPTGLVICSAEEMLCHPALGRVARERLRGLLESVAQNTARAQADLPIETGKGTRWFRLALSRPSADTAEAAGLAWDVTDEVRRQREFEKQRRLRQAQARDALLSLESDLTTDEILNKKELTRAGLASDLTLRQFRQKYIVQALSPDDSGPLGLFSPERLAEEPGQAGGIHSWECRLLSYNGSYEGYRWRSVVYSTLRHPQTGHLHLFLSLWDIHDRKLAELADQENTQRDTLTGLYNRTAFEERVRDALQEDPESTHAFLLLHIDNLRQVNEAHGRDVGDHVLHFVSRRLRSSFRATDLLGHIGGNETAVFIRNIPDAEFALRKGQQICQSMSSWRREEQELKVTCSAGIALAPDHGASFDTLYQCADAALTDARAKGRGSCVLFRTEEERTDLTVRLDQNALLDYVDDLVYVSDPQTHELLYMNQPMMDRFHLSSQDMGHKCYEVLQNRTAPCTFCTNHLLSYQEFYNWYHTNPVTGRTALLRDKLVNWNGHPARMEIVAETSGETVKQAQLDEANRQARLDAKRYRFLVEHAGLAPFEYDPIADELTYTWRDSKNKLCTRNIAHFMETVCSRNIVHPNDAPHFRAVCQEAIRRECTGSFRFWADLEGSGEYREYIAEYASIADAKGRVYHASGKLQAVHKQEDDWTEGESRAVVLVADDVPMNRAALVEALRRDFEVLEAENGLQAQKLLNSNREIQVLLLDLQMPIMDGFTLLEYIHTTPALAELTTIVCTSYNDYDNQLRALHLGAEDCIGKPCNAELVCQRVRNIVAQKRIQRAGRSSRFDALTGLRNRDGFYQATRRLLDTNPDKAFVIVYWNICRFKVVNELFGTDTGDQLLRDIATAMAALDQPHITYGRIESDNFAICVPRDAFTLDQLRENARHHMEHSSVRFDYLLRFGVYYIDEPELNVNTLCDRAKMAMRSVTAAFRDPVAVYSDAMGEAMLEEESLVSDMRRALDESQFEVYYQPIYDVHTERIATAEALVRWNHPQRGMISPALFVPLFERNGFVDELDRYVLDRTCRMQAARRRAEKVVVPISVNLSRVDFYSRDLARELTATEDSYGLPHELIAFEVTESAYADNAPQLLRSVNALKEAGFSILMDDFGSGYSSFNILKDIPVDILKMDLRFLSGLEEGGKSSRIVASIIHMAKWLDLKVVAEGVETAEQMDFLRGFGCDKIQGYYYSRPLPAGVFEEKLDSGEALVYDRYLETLEKIDFDSVWDSGKEINVLFDGMVGGMGMCELYGDQLDILRVNEGYFEIFGSELRRRFRHGRVPLNELHPESAPDVIRACREAERTGKIVKVQALRKKMDQTAIWVELRLRYQSTNGSHSAFYFSVRDITLEHEAARRSELKCLNAALCTVFGRVDLLDFSHNRFTNLSNQGGRFALALRPDDLQASIREYCERLEDPQEAERARHCYNAEYLHRKLREEHHSQVTMQFHSRATGSLHTLEAVLIAYENGSGLLYLSCVRQLSGGEPQSEQE